MLQTISIKYCRQEKTNIGKENEREMLIKEENMREKSSAGV